MYPNAGAGGVYGVGAKAKLPKGDNLPATNKDEKGSSAASGQVTDASTDEAGPQDSPHQATLQTETVPEGSSEPIDGFERARLAYIYYQY